MSSALDSLESVDFAISEESAEPPRVKLSGNADLGAVQRLDEYLVRWQALLSAAKPASVQVDLTELQFMNSSCLKAFASWIHDVNTGATRYTIRMRFNPRLHWQKRSLETLRRLAPAVVELEAAQ